MIQKNIANSEFKHLVFFTPTARLPNKQWVSPSAYAEILQEWESFKRYLTEELGKEGGEWIADSISTTSKFAVRFRSGSTAMQIKLSFNPK